MLNFQIEQQQVFMPIIYFQFNTVITPHPDIKATSPKECVTKYLTYLKLIFFLLKIGTSTSLDRTSMKPGASCSVTISVRMIGCATISK